MIPGAFHPVRWNSQSFVFPVHIAPNRLSGLSAAVLCEGYEKQTVLGGPPEFFPIPDLGEVSGELFVWS